MRVVSNVAGAGLQLLLWHVLRGSVGVAPSISPKQWSGTSSKLVTRGMVMTETSPGPREVAWSL